MHFTDSIKLEFYENVNYMCNGLKVQIADTFLQKNEYKNITFQESKERNRKPDITKK